MEMKNTRVADYIIVWPKLNKLARLLIVIEKLKVLNDVLNKNKKPFMLSFVASQEARTNKFLKMYLFAKKLLEPCLELVVLD